MPREQLIEKLHGLARVDPATLRDADSLIGFFQVFRPDGADLAGAFDDLDPGDQLHARLEQLFLVAGEDRRPEGGRDAYFVVRNPLPIDPGDAESLCADWLDRIGKLARELGDETTGRLLEPIPRIRVLEGIPPKHPKRLEEKSELLKAVQLCVATLTERIESADPHADVLRQAYYFIACDPMLRDYLMWPLYANCIAVDEPFEPYFNLWRHGVKYRIFGEDQVDLYLPRHEN